MRIDTHQHLLLPEHFSYPWTAEVPPLQQRFALEDYHRDAEGHGITQTLFMECDVAPGQAADEARYFCSQAENPARGIAGVIAGGRAEEKGFLDYLDAIAHPALKGIRRVLHVVPDDVSRGTLFRENVAALASRGLTFDICVRSDQHALAAALIEACPQTQFILDHAGCPDIAGDVFTSWRESLGRLAEYDHLSVKISGLPTSCRPGEASAETLRPWVESVIELYGWERVVWGGDWPVCTLNGTLADWCAALDCILAEESADNCNRLYSENARRIYQL